ncbi:MAG: hypothetical protein WDN69_17200 [Aliidongia sp.]
MPRIAVHRAFENLQPVAQASAQTFDPEHAQARGRHFEGKRQAVEMAADLADIRAVGLMQLE